MRPRIEYARVAIGEALDPSLLHSRDVGRERSTAELDQQLNGGASRKLARFSRWRGAALAVGLEHPIERLLTVRSKAAPV